MNLRVAFDLRSLRFGVDGRGFSVITGSGQFDKESLGE
jgi:hypothetical protein